MVNKEHGKERYVVTMFLLILLSILIYCSWATINPKAYAQFIPLPLSGSSKQVPNSDKSVRADHEPPVINFVTDALQTGNNVFKVTITDKSGIDSCKIVYSRGGKDVVLDCINDHDNIYKALINMDSPGPHFIQVYAKDGNGNSSIVVKKLIVQPQKNVFEQIFGRLLHLF
jgi:hypothetical protein